MKESLSARHHQANLNGVQTDSKPTVRHHNRKKQPPTSVSLFSPSCLLVTEKAKALSLRKTEGEDKVTVCLHWNCWKVKRLSVCVPGCSPAGRLPRASDLGRVCRPVAGGGVFRPGHRGAVRQAQRLPAGGAAEPGQPLRASLPRGAQDKAQVCVTSQPIVFLNLAGAPCCQDQGVSLSRSLLLDNERWRQAEVPAEFQDLVDSIAGGRISLPERKIPGIVRQSPDEARILFSPNDSADGVSAPPHSQVQMRRNLLSSCWSTGRNTPWWGQCLSQSP